MPADIQAILKIEVPVSVLVGSRDMSVAEVLNLAPGAIIELPKGSSEELELLVGDKPIGCGRAVKVGENFGLRVTHLGDVRERIRAMASGGATESDGPGPLDPALADLLADAPAVAG